VRRLRTAPKTALAAAGVLATPLFFVALMAISLAVEKPTVTHAVRNGRTVVKLGDTTATTEASIWLLALLPSAIVVLVGTGAMLLGRLGPIVPALATLAAAISLLVPLDTWTSRHTARYPCGVDLFCPTRSTLSQDVYRRGEWEATARHTADQLGIVTIVFSGIAIGLTVLLEVRRRRGAAAPAPPPPPPQVTTGGGFPGGGV
jgi:hypothetical protein